MITRQKAYKLRELILKISKYLDDSDALQGVELFPKWKADGTYEVGDRVLHDGVLYKVLQPHTSQATWTPSNSPSLFAEVLVDENVPLPWVQPDSTNAYMTGDRVLYEGKVYESVIDNNIWSPSAYPQGWRLIE